MPEGASAQTPQDKLLNCVDCGAQFVFSARDQTFYLERGYQAPRRCKTCRDKRKSSQHPTLSPHAAAAAAPAPQIPTPPAPAGDVPAVPAAKPAAPASGAVAPAASGGGGKSKDQNKDQHKVVCSACGVETTVPFKPDPNRPVYCRACYLGRRKNARQGGAPAAPPAVPAPDPAPGSAEGAAPEAAAATPQTPGAQ